MNRRALQRFSRRWHRRLGVIVGIQFLLWTLGGFYFSWFHIDNVRGKLETRKQKSPDLRTIGATLPLQSLLKKAAPKSVKKIQYALWMGQPVVRLYHSRDRVTMLNARTGQQLSPITKDMAIKIARQDFRPAIAVQQVQLVKQKKGEYKGPIPAYRVDFGNRKSTHIYVHANTGIVTARRNMIWRGFDFLWMLHILDFHNREDINNWLLRLLSTLGLFTIGLGYLLWLTTLPLLRNKQEHNPKP